MKNINGTEGPVISAENYRIYERMIQEAAAHEEWDESLRLNRLANLFFMEHMEDVMAMP